MHSGVLILVGVSIGAMLMRWAMVRALRHGSRAHHFDEQYVAARRVAMDHVRMHGTLNLAQLERLTDTRGTIVVRYLEQLERDGLIRAHRHRTTGAFYTKA